MSFSRTQRLNTIRELIQELAIESQEELLHLLRDKGCEVVQTTLSRDLKTLKVSKVANEEGNYIYALSDYSKPATPSEISEVNFLADGFCSLDFSGNQAVIKTLPGYANTIAAVIDNADPFEILGTIAGDDTILVIIREGIPRKELVSSLLNIMPKLKEKLG